MGLFDGLKMMGDIVKGGIVAFKASEKLEALAERSRNEFKSLINADEERLYQEYKKLNDAMNKEEDIDKRNALTEKAEEAAVGYLSALSADGKFPQAFRDEVSLALREYAKTNDSAQEIFAKYMMAQAKTPEEQEEVRKALEEIKAE